MVQQQQQQHHQWKEKKGRRAIFDRSFMCVCVFVCRGDCYDFELFTIIYLMCFLLIYISSEFNLPFGFSSLENLKLFNGPFEVRIRRRKWRLELIYCLVFILFIKLLAFAAADEKMLCEISVNFCASCARRVFCVNRNVIGIAGSVRHV